MKELKDSRFAAIVCILVGLTVAAWQIVVPASRLVRGQPLNWLVPIEHTTDRLAWPAAYVDVAQLPGSLPVWVLARGVLLTALAVGALYCLTRVLIDVASGRPFGKRNALWLRISAALTFATCLVPLFADGFLHAAVLRGLDPSSEILWAKQFGSLEAFLLGIALLLAGMADAFARGREIQEDTEGLI